MRAKKSTMLLTQAIQHTYGIRPVAVAPVIDWSAIRPRHNWFDYPAIGGDSLSILDLETDMFDSLEIGAGKRRVPVVGRVPDADGYYTFPIGQFGAPSPLGVRYAPGAFDAMMMNLPIVTPHHTIKSMRADKNGAVIGEVQFHSNPDNQRLLELLTSREESFSIGVRGFMRDGELLSGHSYNVLPRNVPTFNYEERFTPDREGRTAWFMDALEKSSPGLPARADLSNQYQRDAAEFLVKEGKGTYAECLDFVRKGTHMEIPFVIRPIALDEIKPKGYHSREEKEFGGAKYWVYHMFPTRS